MQFLEFRLWLRFLQFTIMNETETVKKSGVDQAAVSFVGLGVFSLREITDVRGDLH